jgi:hypothetical protein
MKADGLRHPSRLKKGYLRAQVMQEPTSWPTATVFDVKEAVTRQS